MDGERLAERLAAESSRFDPRLRLGGERVHDVLDAGIANAVLLGELGVRSASQLLRRIAHERARQGDHEQLLRPVTEPARRAGGEDRDIPGREVAALEATLLVEFDGARRERNDHAVVGSLELGRREVPEREPLDDDAIPAHTTRPPDRLVADQCERMALAGVPGGDATRRHAIAS